MATRMYGGPSIVVAVILTDLIAVLFLLSPWPSIFLIFHLFSLMIQAYAVRRFHTSDDRGAGKGWALLAMVLSLPLPLFGYLAVLISSAPRHREVGPSALEELKLFTQMGGGLAVRPGLTRSEQMRQALETENHLDSQVGEIFGVRSLVEGGVSERSQIYRLKSFLSNSRSDAYHLAQAEVARLLEHFTIQLAEAGEQARARPGDLEEQHNLAQWHLRFAECGLLEPNLESHYAEMALGRYQEIIAKEPEVLRWRLEAIDILLARGRNAEAISECLIARQRNKESADLWIRLFEAHFQGARGGALEPVRQFFQVIRTLRELQPRDPELQELIRFWTRSAC